MDKNYLGFQVLLTIFLMSLVDPDMPFATSPAFRVPKLCRYIQLTVRQFSRRQLGAYFCTCSELRSRILGQWVKPDQVCVVSLERLLEDASRYSWRLTRTTANNASKGAHQIEKPNMADCSESPLISA